MFVSRKGSASQKELGMTDEAIKSLKTLFMISIAIIVLWLVSWPSAIQKLAQYRDTVDLHAWLFLKDQMALLCEDESLDVFGQEPNAILTEVWVPESSARGDDFRIPKKIMISSTWPSVDKYLITLTPQDFHLKGQQGRFKRVRIYRVETGEINVPFSDYYVVFFANKEALFEENKPAVVPANDPNFIKECGTNFRQLMDSTYRRNFPMSWDKISLHLTKHGFSEPPTKLTSDHPALTKLRLEADPLSDRVQILGIQISIGLFFTTVGLFLAAIAFSMIGPIVALKNAESRARSQTWIMVLPTKGKHSRWMLEVLILGVTIIWAFSPLLLLILQLTAGIDPEVVGGWPLPIGASGLLFSSVIYGLVAWELFICRRAGI